MARRIGCGVGLLLLLLTVAGTALVWLVLSATGVVASAPFARFASAIGLLIGLLAVVASVLLVRRLSTPAQRLVEAARRVETGDYSTRVPVRGPSELRSLARAFNAMSSRLAADESRRRSVLADVAHELRTPLTIVRGQAEAVADGVYPASAEQMVPILAATRTLELLVADLRILALSDAGSLQLVREPVDVSLLVHDALDALRPLAATAGVSLTEAVDPAVGEIVGDAARLSGVLANLVENALRHTSNGGTVRLAATAAPEGGVEITVSDDGEGIAPELLPRVFDRFVKGPGSPGSGLGLAIVRGVVEAHSGTVTAESTPGRGTVVSVHLPS